MSMHCPHRPAEGIGPLKLESQMAVRYYMSAGNRLGSRGEQTDIVLLERIYFFF